VDLIHPEGAPPFMIQGYAGERAITDGWEARHGIPVVTSGQTQVEALRALNVRKVVGSTYTTGETNAAVQRYFDEAGIAMPRMAALEVPFQQAGFVGHTQVYHHTKRAFLDTPGADGILLFGSGWRSLDAIELLEQDLGVPVVHAVTARVWYVQRRMHLNEPVPGHGQLLLDMPPLP
ncbi:MAG: hypothetical protein VW450_09275, partial [Chloroflexota bacterium]